LDNPFEQALAVKDFLGAELAVEKMISAVDKTLDREKSSKQ